MELRFCSPLPCACAWPIVGAERRSRQAFLVVEVALRASRPGIPYCNGRAHFLAGNDYLVAFNSGIRPVKLSVRAGNGKSLQRFTTRFEPVAHKSKADMDFVPGDFHGLVDWPGIDNLAAIGGSQRPERQSAADLSLSGRMQVLRIADVDGHCQPRVPHCFGRPQLRDAQLWTAKTVRNTSMVTASPVFRTVLAVHNCASRSSAQVESPSGGLVPRFGSCTIRKGESGSPNPLRHP